MKKVWLIYSYPYLDKEKENDVSNGTEHLRAVVLSKDLVMREISRWFDNLIYYEAGNFGTESDIVEETCRAILAEDWFARKGIPDGNGQGCAAYGVSIECMEGVDE